MESPFRLDCSPLPAPPSPPPRSPPSCTCPSPLLCPSMQAGRFAGRLSTAPSSSLLAWRPCRHAAPGPGQSLAREPHLGSHVASILLFSGPAWDILHFPSLPLWEPLSPPPAPCFGRCPRASCGQRGPAWNPRPASAAVTAS